MKNKPPFFVLGAQRSGTTMLRLMLNHHPRLAVPHETRFIVNSFRRLTQYPDLTDRATLERLLDDIEKEPAVRDGEHVTDREKILSHPIANFADLVDAIMSEKATSLGKERWGDKTPFYVSEVDVLWKVFPDARIVHLVRDGRDVAVSQRKIEWAGNSIPRLAHDWRWKVTVCHKVGSVRSDQFMELRYEDLVRDPAENLRLICEFLDEDFAPEMLDYHKTAESSVPSKSLKWHRNSVKAPDVSKLGVWKQQLSQSDRIIYEQIAGDALEMFGYERERLPSNFSSRLKNLYYASVVRW